jgi:hypothetical protein
MKKTIRINNIPFDNVIVTEEGKNIIYAKSCKEEFFGVYNIKIGDKSILCESNTPDKIYCEIILDGRVYENIPFEIVKSENSRIIINKNIIDKNIMNEETLQNEILKLKREIRGVSKQKTLLNESVENNYKQELLSEFFKVVNENEHIIENKISILENELSQTLQETLQETVEKSILYFRKENSESLRNNINELYSEMSLANKKDIEQITENFKKQILSLQKEQEDKISKNISVFSEDNQKVLKELENAKKNTFDVVFEGIEKSKKNLLESFESAMEKHKNEFSSNFVSKFEKLIKDREEQISKQTNDILENHNKNVVSLMEKKKMEMEDSSKEILTEANKKIKNLEKKVDTLNNQLNKSNNEKKRIDSLLQDSRKYTDSKINQVLEESKKFTRIMMDMVGGGGGGSVAVQYAAGGNIAGNLNVSGTISSGGLTTEGSILSGDRDLTDIFAGEGEGDTNTLDGGMI